MALATVTIYVPPRNTLFTVPPSSRTIEIAQQDKTFSVPPRK